MILGKVSFKSLLTAIVIATLVLTSRIAAVAQEGAGGEAKPGGKVVGVWDGTTLASCSASLPQDRCNAQQKVSITVLEGENGKLGGFYKCSYGTQDCYHLNESGKVVDATVTGTLVSMRVMMPDGTTCNFTGRPDENVVNGGYTCTSGGPILERGVWRARRNY
jgi:hypothetical protein